MLDRLTVSSLLHISSIASVFSAFLGFRANADNSLEISFRCSGQDAASQFPCLLRLTRARQGTENIRDC